MSALPTVRIKHPDGYAVINEADFDPAKHERLDAEAKPKPKQPRKPRKKS